MGEVFLLLLNYFASSLPAGPGIKISEIFVSVDGIDYQSQKKNYIFLSKLSDKMQVF